MFGFSPTDKTTILGLGILLYAVVGVATGGLSIVGSLPFITAAVPLVSIKENK